jgi:hypothetical protein
MKTLNHKTKNQIRDIRNTKAGMPTEQKWRPVS